jgi:hypothetical protein
VTVVEGVPPVLIIKPQLEKLVLVVQFGYSLTSADIPAKAAYVLR